MILVTAILRIVKATSHFLMSAKIPKPLFINSIKALFSTAVHQTLAAKIRWKWDFAKLAVPSCGKQSFPRAGLKSTTRKKKKKSQALHCFLYACHLPQRTLPLIYKPTGYNWQGQ